MQQEYQIRPIEQPDDSVWGLVGGGIHNFNIEQAGADNSQMVCYGLYTPENELVGGMIGETHWDWLYINLMFIRPELRNQGYGSILLEMAEAEARARGARYAYLDTFSFQAPAFYLKHGYRVFGELRNFPAGHIRYYLTKSL